MAGVEKGSDRKQEGGMARARKEETRTRKEKDRNLQRK